MKRKFLKRSVIIPIVLLIYLCIMAYIGWPHYSAQGQYVEYAVLMIISLGAIVGLFFILKRRDKQREELRNQRAASYRRGIRNDDIR